MREKYYIEEWVWERWCASSGSLVFGGIITAWEGSEDLLDFSVSKIPSDTFIFSLQDFLHEKDGG
jgi:hypothetical protein